MAKHQVYPHGWDEKRIQKVLTHYENQTEEEAVAEDEAAYEKGRGDKRQPTVSEREAASGGGNFA